MKILVSTARYFPEQFSIVKICECLVKMGHDVSVVTGKPNYGYWKILEGYENVREEYINGVKVYRVNEVARTKGFIGLLKNYLSISKAFNAFFRKHNVGYDVVISHVLSPIFTMRGIGYFCRKFNIPHVHYGLDLWPESLVASSYFSRLNPIFQVVKKYSKNLYKTCDYITFASPSAESYFRNYLKIEKIPFKQIYQPTLTNIPDIDFVKNHKYGKDVIHILYCGSVARFHRLDLFIEALSIYRKLNLREISFDIVGSGSELDHLKTITNKFNLNEVVTFHGRVSSEETRVFYQKADVLYVPLENNSATSKMIPQKLIEYFMYNRPIMGMIVGDGKNLLNSASRYNIVCNQSKEDLTDGLINLANNIDYFEKCGDENRLFFENNPRFLLKNIAQELSEICRKLQFKNNMID